MYRSTDNGKTSVLLQAALSPYTDMDPDFKLRHNVLLSCYGCLTIRNGK